MSLMSLTLAALVRKGWELDCREGEGKEGSTGEGKEEGGRQERERDRGERERERQRERPHIMDIMDSMDSMVIVEMDMET
jgi:hypothetical protein